MKMCQGEEVIFKKKEAAGKQASNEGASEIEG
jgi:hypothetical protein